MDETKLPNIYKWLRTNIDIEKDAPDAIKQDLVNGIIYDFKMDERSAKQSLELFLNQKFDKPEDLETHKKYTEKIRMAKEDDILIDYSELKDKKISNGVRRMICHNCKKSLPEIVDGFEYCDLKCKEQYINNIILFWKPDIITQYNERDQRVEVLQNESRLAFLSMVRDADPDELRLRIKVLKHVLREAYEIGYDTLERDKMRTEFEAEFTSKEISKKHTAERDRALIENAELKRELESIRKSGDKVNPKTKESLKSTGKVLTGVCLNCGVETLKETCSEKCKLEWKSIQGMMKLPGFTIEKAREAVKKLNEQSIN
jgi:hypothetical protein